MSLNEEQQAVFDSYAQEIDDYMAARFFRVPLGGIPETVADLQTDLFEAYSMGRLTPEQFNRTLDLCDTLHNHVNPLAVIAELKYDRDDDGNTWLVLEGDDDDNV